MSLTFDELVKNCTDEQTRKAMINVHDDLLVARTIIESVFGLSQGAYPDVVFPVMKALQDERVRLTGEA